MRKAAFLDRDGVINRKAPEGQYVTIWDSFEFLPQVAEGIHLLHDAGFAVVVITNQRCVAKGMISEPGLQSLHRRMRDHLAAQGAILDAIYYCPHDNLPPCDCRKPAPGMILHAAREHAIYLPDSWMIGDSDVDMQAGKSAGCRTARVLSNGMSLTATPSDLSGSSLYEVAQAIVALPLR